MAGRICEQLAQRYGEDSVFFDIDSVPAGCDYREHIRNAIRSSTVLVAIIGRAWVGDTRDASSRIRDAHDPVRLEIETALASAIPLIPVLIEHASIPTEAELPPSLAALPYLNAISIDSGRDFRIHVGRLIAALDRVVSPGRWRAMVGRFHSQRILATGSMAGLALVGAIVAVPWLPIHVPHLFGSAKAPAAIEVRTNSNGFVIGDSSDRPLERAELLKLTAEELRIARNEIFARKGRFFRDPRLAAYFSRFSWYNPQYVEVPLSPLEQSNVALIQTVEQSRR